MPYTITHCSSPTLLSYIEFRMFLKIHMLLPQRSLKETNLILELSILKLFLKYHYKSSALFQRVLTASTSQSSPTLCCVFFLLIFFFNVDHLKSLYWICTILLLILMFFFFFLIFGCKTCGILASWQGIEPAPSALESEVLTTGPPGKSHYAGLC